MPGYAQHVLSISQRSQGHLDSDEFIVYYPKLVCAVSFEVERVACKHSGATPTICCWTCCTVVQMVNNTAGKAAAYSAYLAGADVARGSSCCFVELRLAWRSTCTGQPTNLH